MTNRKSNMEDKIKQLKQMIEIQCRDGNWNYNEYMRGMANGMLLMMATLEGKEPDYFSTLTSG